MEIKINKEIRSYTESIFFGLSVRQFIYSILACAIAVLIYFSSINTFGMEITSWLCILGAAPFAAAVQRGAAQPDPAHHRHRREPCGGKGGPLV